ncbi:P-loop containing nucleoside triphosphate hydrolase protein [Punctularia strigosozonata HHB-11173 SS5]|uniref:P-loop containing nucleoside triphosphate hydrolase protein n=1 Tax=Punctularia strigosozonata (strain HHB-11173) TaxID=741275 RepID=UPI00044171F8|nr:P-loop containing nucleoside triphosphate hydrolase protein [Punctularia strigosozonata HHB-11173 SS5]EIN07870.1 P-loop containing nucleoside triphosphate hydrolase protein [Punctularia strigosozonata HHB-11173 SS5]
MMRKTQAKKRNVPLRHDRGRSSTPRRAPGIVKPSSGNPLRVEPVIPLTVDDDTKAKLLEVLQRHAPNWTRQTPLRHRLLSWGVDPKDVTPLCRTFLAELLTGAAYNPSQFHEAELARIAANVLNGQLPGPVDQALTRLLYMWATNPDNAALLSSRVSPDTTESMHNLYASTDLSYPAERFPNARSMRRKIIMHVGPTNSGKTHNALRALAAARTGVYAGPLRLLAHEIWERLNKGQIVPLGAPESLADADDAIGPDIGDGIPAAHRDPRAPYARQCNLVTGEEQRIVNEAAGLTSCTVEMLSPLQMYDVGVVDEIQLIKDDDRGGAWTSAVLSLCAKELHLCGDETAVPIIEDIVKDTGDELIINRYQRLTPLHVAPKSLESNFKNVKKGDCVVTFSRNNIFQVKEQIEEETGLRCAVAYGRLPPELRSKQAALFNDPKSGYDVIVGSDAIGLGLNLKINRVVFEAMHKWDGETTQVLPTPLIKQIAGRAGRYGLHGQGNAGGVVTCLHEEDMPILRAAMEAPLDQQREARLHINAAEADPVFQALPRNTTTSAAFEALHHLGRTRPPYLFVLDAKYRRRTEFVDRFAGDLTLAERMTLLNAPFQLRGPLSAGVAEEVVTLYRNKFVVWIEAVIQKFKLKETLLEVLDRMEREEMGQKAEALAGMDPEYCVETMAALEQLHKTLAVHVWYGYRNPVAFPDMAYAEGMKEQVEKAMNWTLKTMAGKKIKTKLKSLQKSDLEEEGFSIAYAKSKKAARAARRSASA